MGTSVSQPSPRDSNWKRAFVCYRAEEVPFRRIVSEVWRAWDNDQRPISAELKSDILFKCYQSVTEASNAEEALASFTQHVRQVKGNSIVVEFAKRAIATSKQPESTADWTQSFFAQLTRYVVSRDASGYIGREFRNGNVKELADFKDTIASAASRCVAPIDTISSRAEWDNFVDSTVSGLKELT
jgi:hypothetical protein